MGIGNWLLLAIIFWLGGYFSLRFIYPTTKTKLAYVPKFMYILFGCPKHPAIPDSVVAVRSIFIQVFAISMGLFGSIVDGFDIPLLRLIFGFTLPLLLGIITSQWFFQKSPYSLENDRDITQ